MKRIFFICIGIILFFSGTGYSAGTITVTSPNGGENWKIGTTHNITWNSSGVSGNVTLQLFRSSTLLGIIHPTSTISLNAGTYRWNIPARLPNGAVVTPASNYRVRVFLGPRVKDFSNSNFTILSASSLPRALNPPQIGTTKRRIQAGPTTQRAPARTTRQQAKTNHQRLAGFTPSPDLQITNLSSAIDQRSTIRNLVTGEFRIVNRGTRKSSICAVKIEFRSDDSLIHFEITQSVPALAPGSQIERTFRFAPLGPPHNPYYIIKHGGWYTTIVTIDPTGRSGENNIARMMSNTKTIRHHIEELPFMVGCINAFFFSSPVKLSVTFKNIGGAVMPASYFSLRTNCPKLDFSKTYKEYHPALQPGEKRDLYFHFKELQPIISLCANAPNAPGASVQDAEVQFILDLDPEGLSSESRGNEQLVVRKSCSSLNVDAPMSWILLSKCSGIYSQAGEL